MSDTTWLPDLRSLDRTCGGTGWLNCECGGDFCVCNLHGGMDCPGCVDCRDYDQDHDYDGPEEGQCECGEWLTSYGNCPQCEPLAPYVI